MSFNEDYRIRPPADLTVEEMNLCTLIYSYPDFSKPELFVLACRTCGWDALKFNQIYKSLIEKGAIITSEQ
ncbi:MAG: hypothetical protein ACMG57_01260 [Candidatus Dojkabacteria bacterium]